MPFSGFPEFLAADVVYLENMTSDLFVESEADVYRYGLAFDQLCTLALSEDESKAFIAATAGLGDKMIAEE